MSTWVIGPLFGAASRAIGSCRPGSLACRAEKDMLCPGVCRCDASGAREGTLSQILQAAEAEGFTLSAYCFMPDHAHLIAVGNEPWSDARAFMTLAKRRSGYWYWERNRAARLWQRSYWDRVLRTDTELRLAMQYVLQNPVRAGLVPRPLDYPFSGSAVHRREDLLDVFIP